MTDRPAPTIGAMVAVIGSAGAIVLVPVLGLAIAARVVFLDSMPGEWYGDISTVYEYVRSLRAGELPEGWFVLGIGPLYPFLIRPVLWVMGDSYFADQGCLRAHQRGWRGHVVRRCPPAVRASRGIGQRRCCRRVVMVAHLQPPRRSTDAQPDPGAVRSGVVSGCSAFATIDRVARVGGTDIRPRALPVRNSFVLPIVVGAVFAAELQRRHELLRSTSLFAGTAVLTVAPVAIACVRRPSDVASHYTSRLDLGWHVIADVVRGTVESALAYVGRGDPISRSNAAGNPLVDKLSLVLLVIGFAYIVIGVGKLLQPLHPWAAIRQHGDRQIHH